MLRIMKETTSKKREKAREAKSEKKAETGPEPQDVEMPEEDTATTGKSPKELDTLTLEGSYRETLFPMTGVKGFILMNKRNVNARVFGIRSCKMLPVFWLF